MPFCLELHDLTFSYLTDMFTFDLSACASYSILSGPSSMNYIIDLGSYSWIQIVLCSGSQAGHRPAEALKDGGRVKRVCRATSRQNSRILSSNSTLYERLPMVQLAN